MLWAIVHLFKSAKRTSMKKSFIFIFLIVILASKIQAQDLKGKIGIGLNLSPPDNPTRISNTNPWQISPNIGYFLGNSWQVGVRASLYNHRNGRSNTNTNNQNTFKSWWLEFMSTHYQWLSAQWGFFAENSIGYRYSHSKSNEDYSTQTIKHFETKVHNIEFNTRVGAMFMISKRFGVNLSSKIFNLSYAKTNTTHSNLEVFERNNYTNEDTNLTASFLVGGNLSFLSQLQLGLRYFL